MRRETDAEVLRWVTKAVARDAVRRAILVGQLQLEPGKGGFGQGREAESGLVVEGEAEAEAR